MTVPDWVPIANSIVLAALLLKSLFTGFATKKGANLADKQDIQEITDKIEQVRSEYNIKLEQLRAELSTRGHSKNVLYEREFKALEQIWNEIIRLKQLALRLRPLGQDKKGVFEFNQQVLDEYLDQFEKAYEAVDNNRPFYPDELYPIFCYCIRIIDNHKVKFEDAIPEQWEELETSKTEIYKITKSLGNTVRLRIDIELNERTKKEWDEAMAQSKALLSGEKQLESRELKRRLMTEQKAKHSID